MNKRTTASIMTRLPLQGEAVCFQIRYPLQQQAAVTPETAGLPKLPIDSGHPSTPGVGSELELRKGDSISKC